MPQEARHNSHGYEEGSTSTAHLGYILWAQRQILGYRFYT